MLDTQPSEALLLTGSIANGNMIVWLVFANIFITTLLVVVVSLCFSQRKTYKRQLRAACVHSYGNFSKKKIVNNFTTLSLFINFAASSPSDITIRTATATVPNTNKHSMQGSNPIWLKAYTNEWYKNDDDLSHNNDVGGGVPVEDAGPDSLDENVLTAEPYTIENDSNKEFNGFMTQNNLSPFNVYQQIDRLTNSAQILSRKLETTEL